MRIMVLSMFLLSGCTSMSVQFNKEERIFECKGECLNGLKAQNAILEQQAYAAVLQSLIK